MTASCRDESRRFVTAFPAVTGNHVPECGLPDADLVKLLRQKPPPWLYHLEGFAAEVPGNLERFPAVERSWIRHLAELLRLPAADYDVAALELVPKFREVEDVGEVSFPVRLRPRSRSFTLAVVLTLASVAGRRAIPSWVVSSGALPVNLDAALCLERIASIEEKIQLCLGRDHRFNMEFLLDRLYQGQLPPPENTYGPRSLRAVSGKIKLLIVPAEVDGWSSQLRDRLGVADVGPTNLADFGHEDFAELQRRVEEMAEGGMLVVQVRTVHQALRLLGFHHVLPALSRGTHAASGRDQLASGFRPVV
jgi:hypothetical protein